MTPQFMLWFASLHGRSIFLSVYQSSAPLLCHPKNKRNNSMAAGTGLHPANEKPATMRMELTP